MNFNRQFQYNEQITGRFIDQLAAKPNSPEAVRNWLSHILTAAHLWICRITEKENEYGVWQSLSVEEMKRLNREVHEQIFALLESSNLHHVCYYKNTKGQPFNNTLDEIFTHLIIHSAHHRAQISSTWRNAGIEPPVSDFIAWAREGS